MTSVSYRVSFLFLQEQAKVIGYPIRRSLDPSKDRSWFAFIKLTTFPQFSILLR